MEGDYILSTLGRSADAAVVSGDELVKICADVASASANQPTAAISTVTDLDSTPTGNVTYCDVLNIGATFWGPYVPHMHRMMSLSTTRNLDKNSEYVMVNKRTGMLQYYDVEEISCNNVGFVLGISMVILKENSINGVNQCARHDVPYTPHLGQSCCVASQLQNGLCLALYEHFVSKFKREVNISAIEGYHALVVPAEEMTLDDFVSRFCYRDNCSFIAGGDLAEATTSTITTTTPTTTIGTDDNPAGQIPLAGVDNAVGKLIKLLNAYRGNFSGSTLRLANAIRAAIVSNPNSKSWDGLIANMTIASGINVLLHHLSSTVDPLQHVSSAILIESLQDSLNLKYGFQDEWEVVNVTERISNVL